MADTKQTNEKIFSITAAVLFLLLAAYDLIGNAGHVFHMIPAYFSSIIGVLNFFGFILYNIGYIGFAVSAVLSKKDLALIFGAMEIAFRVFSFIADILSLGSYYYGSVIDLIIIFVQDILLLASSAVLFFMILKAKQNDAIVKKLWFLPAVLQFLFFVSMVVVNILYGARFNITFIVNIVMVAANVLAGLWLKESVSAAAPLSANGGAGMTVPRFDPMTGAPLNTVPQQFTPRFDPMTGAPLSTAPQYPSQPTTPQFSAQPTTPQYSSQPAAPQSAGTDSSGTAAGAPAMNDINKMNNNIFK